MCFLISIAVSSAVVPFFFFESPESLRYGDFLMCKVNPPLEIKGVYLKKKYLGRGQLCLLIHFFVCF